MNNKQLKNIAKAFQTAIYKAKDDGRLECDQMFRMFPRRCCGVASELLARYILDNVDSNSCCVKYISGTYYKEYQNHAWLVVDSDYVVDITINQFSEKCPPLQFKENIYVGPYIDYYDIFEVNHEEWCDNHYPLDNTPVRGYMTRKQLYEIILSYMEKD